MFRWSDKENNFINNKMYILLFLNLYIYETTSFKISEKNYFSSDISKIKVVNCLT